MPDSTLPDSAAKRVWQRAPEEARRADLIRATIDCVADGGVAVATVREVAARAGVSNGLIRYHFATKEALVLAAYKALVDEMTRAAEEAASEAPPSLRLARFIAANCRPPVLDARSLSAWAGFVGHVRNDPEMAAIHRAGYLRFCALLETAIAGLALGGDTARQARQIAAIIDGLWLEGCLAPELFANGELARLALDGAGRILNTPLTDPEETRP
ncbi:MAG TPA: TetR family transcriptional regulator C-terminal domain-containing protein [Albidovulum sp.]|uniref:TetR/AcrR family transcriptional regulator n=1 Tax=Albidovulum sp. TaxID=1872424 RepID=UPI002CA1E0F6|nr:TetR family transcriptional regulator C-terminal domain-containing protein [Albidovulum sp.]